MAYCICGMYAIHHKKQRKTVDIPQSTANRIQREGTVSLRLGHIAALTTIQVVIHHRNATALPIRKNNASE